MNYGEIKKCDIANGEGIRVSLFVSGCTHHCKGCFNSDTWDFNFGKEFTQETEDYIIDLLNKSYISAHTAPKTTKYKNNSACCSIILART